MRVELDFRERAYYANLLRIRAARQRLIAESRSASGTRQELEAEASWCEAQAQRLDDGEEPAAISETKPIQVTPRRDIDAVDAPKNGGGA